MVAHRNEVIEHRICCKSLAKLEVFSVRTKQRKIESNHCVVFIFENLWPMNERQSKEKLSQIAAFGKNVREKLVQEIQHHPKPL
jgi:hypothetical protein